MARLASQAVAGYYPTPEHLLPLIAGALSYAPLAHYERLTFGDPCAGEGTALRFLCDAQRAVTAHTRDAHVCAVELEATRAAKCQETFPPYGNSVLHGDAFQVVGFRDTLDLLYLNPPYDLDREHGRLEQRFLARFTEALGAGGVLVFVVPAHALTASAEYLATHYEEVGCFRFPDPDYAAFKQVVLYARCCAERLVSDSTIAEQVRAWAAAPLEIPTLDRIGLCRWQVRPVSRHSSGWTLAAFDRVGLVKRYVPHHRTQGLKLVPSVVSMPAPSDLGVRRYPTALPPKAAHLAAGIASGVFDGLRLAPDDASLGLPPLLVKGVFDREYVAVEQKHDKAGNVVSTLEVQQPSLSVTALDLNTLTYHELRAESVPSGGTSIATATTADLLSWYSRSMLKALLQHCPVVHDPSQPAHRIPLAASLRPLYDAQAHAVMAAVKLLGGSGVPLRTRRHRSAFILGEIGSGKTICSLVTARTCGAKKVLVFCPPHLLTSWTEQVAATFADATVSVLSSVVDVDAFAALPATTFHVGVVSRETAKLSHAFSAVGALTPRMREACPKCGAVLPRGDLAEKRARCRAQCPMPEDQFTSYFLKFFWLFSRVFASSVDVPETGLAWLPSHQNRWLLHRRKAPLTEEQCSAAVAARAADPRVRRYLRYLLDGAAAESTWFVYKDKVPRGVRLLSAVESLLEALGDASLVAQLIRYVAATHRTQGGMHVLRALVRRFPLSSDVQTCVREAFAAYVKEHPWSRSEDPFTPMTPVEQRAADAEKTLPAKTPAQCVVDAITSLYRETQFTMSAECGEPLFQAEPAPRRVPLATYITTRHRALADFLILDEAHELATSGSAQELAGHRLASLGWPTLYLTGSVMNGYAESLFANFWAVSRSFREEFQHDAVRAFVDRYGYRKRVVTEQPAKPSKKYGAQSDRVLTTTRDAGNAPGVLPVFVLRHLLAVSVPLHKADLKLDLPPCVERPVPVRPSAALLQAHTRLKDALFQQVKLDAFTERAGKLWGQVAELPGHLDRASADTGNVEDKPGPYVVAYPDGTKVCSEPPVYAASDVMPKERWLLDTLRAELQEGRRVLVLTYHTNVMPRIARLIEAELGERAATLYAAKVPTAKRQAWIDAEVIAKKVRVLIANPTTIQTGLNNLVWFSTIAWVQNPACNPYVYRQANGRIDRIGQKAKETRVFFPYYDGTAQKALQTLLAQKVSISMATDGIDPASAMAAAGMGQDLTLAALSVGRQLYKLLGGEED